MIGARNGWVSALHQIKIFFLHQIRIFFMNYKTLKISKLMRVLFRSYLLRGDTVLRIRGQTLVNEVDKVNVHRVQSDLELLALQIGRERMA